MPRQLALHRQQAIAVEGHAGLGADLFEAAVEQGALDLEHVQKRAGSGLELVVVLRHQLAVRGGPLSQKTHACLRAMIGVPGAGGGLLNVAHGPVPFGHGLPGALGIGVAARLAPAGVEGPVQLHANEGIGFVPRGAAGVQPLVHATAQLDLRTQVGFGHALIVLRLLHQGRGVFDLERLAHRPRHQLLLRRRQVVHGGHMHLALRLVPDHGGIAGLGIGQRLAHLQLGHPCGQHAFVDLETVGQRQAAALHQIIDLAFDRFVTRDIGLCHRQERLMTLHVDIRLDRVQGHGFRGVEQAEDAAVQRGGGGIDLVGPTIAVEQDQLGRDADVGRGLQVVVFGD